MEFESDADYDDYAFERLHDKNAGGYFEDNGYWDNE